MTKSDGSALDSTIFTLNSIETALIKEMHVQTTDAGKAGDYSLKFRAYRFDNPTVESTGLMTVKLIDPCAAPVSLTASALQNLFEHTVTKLPSLTYTV